MIRFIFRSDLTRRKQRISLSSSKIINAKVAFLIAKELVVYFNSDAFSVEYAVQLLMLELNIGCDEACFCRLLEQYTASVSQDAVMEILILVAADDMKLAA